jgi:hypothetical protein
MGMNLTTKEAIAMGLIESPPQKPGRAKDPDGMNKLERDYARRLELLKQRGDVLWFGFEKVKFRLAVKTFYDADFLVLLPSGRWEVHEVKGFMRDDAAVKLKVVAEHLPMRVVLVTRARGNWCFKTIPGAVDRIEDTGVGHGGAV